MSRDRLSLSLSLSRSLFCFWTHLFHWSSSIRWPTSSRPVSFYQMFLLVHSRNSHSFILKCTHAHIHTRAHPHAHIWVNPQFFYPFCVPKQSKNFFRGTPVRYVFLTHYTSYYVKKMLINRKPVGNIHFCCISFFSWKNGGLWSRFLKKKIVDLLIYTNTSAVLHIFNPTQMTTAYISRSEAGKAKVFPYRRKRYRYRVIESEYTYALI